MNKFIFVGFVSAYTLLFSPVKVSALSVELGPLNVRVNSDVQVQDPASLTYNDPICRAIREHKLVLIQVQKKDKVERIIFEPYVFGYNKKGDLILQGFQIDQVAFNDTSIKPKNEDGEGYFGGILSTFKGSDWTDFSVDQVIDVQVVEDSDFNMRNGVFENIKEENRIIKPICVIHA